MTVLGTVQTCWRYPVKSMQGLVVDELVIGTRGIEGDRDHALIDVASGRVLSAKRAAELLMALADDEGITLPDGARVAFDAPDASAVLSAWLDRDVVISSTDQIEIAEDGTSTLSYDMTFDPPDDSAEYYEIPIPSGTFLDLAPVHLVATATLAGCRDARPDLDWDVRRFRPNLVLDVPGDVFVEDDWTGRRLGIGDELELDIVGPTVRCAMPLRAQPAVAAGGVALAREPDLFHAMGDLHTSFPNHLGAYAYVTNPGTVAVGDSIQLR